MPGVPTMPRLMFITLMLLATRLATSPSIPELMSSPEPEPALLNTFAPAQLQPGATPRSLLKPSPTLLKLFACTVTLNAPTPLAASSAVEYARVVSGVNVVLIVSGDVPVATTCAVNPPAVPLS